MKKTGVLFLCFWISALHSIFFGHENGGGDASAFLRRPSVENLRDLFKRSIILNGAIRRGVHEVRFVAQVTDTNVLIRFPQQNRELNVKLTAPFEIAEI